MLALLAGASAAQGAPQAPIPDADALDMNLSPECRAPMSRLYRLGFLNNFKAVLEAKRPIRVLAFGSPLGGDSGSTAVPYASRLEEALERALPGVDVQVEERGSPGEITSDATERIMNVVTAVEPDLVVWKVGTNDALARADIDAFKASLQETLQWLRSHGIPVVLVEPPYTRAMASDAYYAEFVAAINEVARANDTPVMLRYETTRYFAAQRTRTGQNHFRLRDLMQRCVPEYVSRTVVLSLESPGSPLQQSDKTRNGSGQAPPR